MILRVEEVENSLQVPIDIVKSSGQDLLDAVIGVYENDDFSTDRRKQISGNVRLNGEKGSRKYE